MPLSNVPRNEARAAMLSLGVAVILVVSKFVAYQLTGSAAIFSDALETIVNVAAAGFAMYSLSLAHTPADQEHPYGHGKIEFFSAGFEGGMILLASLLAILKAIDALFHPALIEHNLIAGIGVMAGALILNGVVGLLLIRIGQTTGSVTLQADGRHLLSDAITSVAALSAIITVKLTGLRWIDPVAAILVALYIAAIGVGLMHHAAGGLMDRQDRQDTLLLENILDAHLGSTGKAPQICSYHKLRHRHSGRYHWVDFHIMVPAQWDVKRGHEVASAIEYEIEQALGEGNATAHIEPCTGDRCRGAECGMREGTKARRDEGTK